MKLQFDGNLQFQLDAIEAVTGVFDGQPLGDVDFSVVLRNVEGVLGSHSELGISNRLVLDEEALLANVRKVQEKNELELAPLLQGMHFSVEMETGTGKTYVYLRTIFELSRRYGFTKFIIVVPSIAIREGVLKNLQITRDHFKNIYNQVPLDFYVYDSKKVSQLRQFATSNHIQILVINIDAFNKKDIAVMYQPKDGLSGRKPIEYISATNPIAIVDEPQNMESETAREAIDRLNPLCTLRYSATHRNPYNLLYKLDPVKAYDLKLVKKIEVASVVSEDSFNQAFLKLNSVDNKKGISAKLSIISEGKISSKTVKVGTDLFVISKDNELYRNRYVVGEINTEPGNEFVQFINGITVTLGQTIGGMTDEVMKVQIRNTIQEHLEKELRLTRQGIKVLSLFFIDRVANFRYYDEGNAPQKGKIASWFEECFKELTKKPRYAEFAGYPLDKIYDGYFSQDKKGILKDTSGTTKDDEDVYTKIMKNKEQLLSMEEPLRFIFSHSALREGWDNPNVFQICTLNESKSEMKKRQEIGRGLRLPVNSEGMRIFDESINRLTVIANESYDDFARKLQTELEEDFGIKFGRVRKDAFAKIKISIGEEEAELGKERSEKVWNELVSNGYLNGEGAILPAFNPDSIYFNLEVSDTFKPIKETIVDVVNSYRFERRIENASQKKRISLNKQVYFSPAFKELWERIAKKTTYSVEYGTEEIITQCAEEISTIAPIEAPRIRSEKAEIDIQRKGVSGIAKSVRIDHITSDRILLPDILAFIQKQTELTRHTIAQILVRSNRLADFPKNPQKFMEQVVRIIKRQMHKLMIKGIRYEKVENEYWEMRLIEEDIDKGLIRYLNRLLEVRNSVYDFIEFESDNEKKFAQKLDAREDIKVFMKLPAWFKIETPVGTYNPDWAIVKQSKEGGERLYLVRETKSTLNSDKLRPEESDKIKCAERHYKALGDEVNFKVVNNADMV